MQNFKSKKILQKATAVFNGKPETVFPYLCPTKEYEWIEGWKCDLIFSESGFAEDLCVFKTSKSEIGEETWVCTTYIPHTKIEYTRFSEDKIIRLSFNLNSTTGNKSEYEITFTVISLNENGNVFIDGFDSNYAEKVYAIHLAKLLNYYLDNGKMYVEE